MGRASAQTDGDASKGLDAVAGQARWGLPDPATVGDAPGVRLAALREVGDAIWVSSDASLAERNNR